MSLTPTKPIPLGFDAPDFNLPDVVSGKTISLKEVRGKKGMLVSGHMYYDVIIYDLYQKKLW